MPGRDKIPNYKIVYTVASSQGWKRDDIHKLIELWYGKTSAKDLDESQVREVTLHLETHPPGALSKHDPNTLNMEFRT